MKTHTAQFKNALKDMGRQIHSIITYGNTTLEDELYSVTPHFEGNILKSVMKQLDIESSVDIPLNTVLNYQLGVYANGDYEYMNYGNYVVYSSEKQEDRNTYKIVCYDKMLYAMKPYALTGVTFPMTLKNYLLAIGTKIGLTVKNTNFYNNSISLSVDRYKDLTDYTYRDVLDEIAEATGSIIIINASDQIEVKYYTNTLDTIDEEYLKDNNINFAEKYGPLNSVVLSRSGESDNVYIQDAASVEANGLHEIKIVDNQLMNFNDRSDYLQGILNAVNGLYFYLNDFESIGILYYEIGDLYNVSVRGQSYQCLMLNDEIDVTGGIEELIHTDSPEESVTDYTKADKTDRRINQTYLIVDKQNQSIEAVISTVDGQTESIASLTATVGELNSKISEATNTTITEQSTTGTVTLTGINASEPIKIQIKPLGSNISYLYPMTTLYPSNTLYMPDRRIKFKNTTTNETFYYELPTDLLYFDSTHYDEFLLDFNDGINKICRVTKRAKYHADGTVYAINETTEDYDYPLIELTEGDYTVSIPGYNNVDISVTLVSKNIYTAQFVTRVEERSDITQTAQAITASVNQKLTNYSTTTEMNSAIEATAQSISAEVSRIYVDKDNYQIDKASILATTSSLSLEVSHKVNDDEFTHAQIVAKINDNTSEVLINANKINLTGYLTISSASNTYLTKSNAANTYATNSGLSGGTTTINGGCITTGIIKSSNYESGLTGTAINLSNGVIDSAKFKVNASGQITATGGQIGGWTISPSALYTSSNNYYLGTTGITATIGETSRSGLIFKAGSNFGVSSIGTLYANNANISGRIVATSGEIGGCTISNGTLTIKNANIESINGSKISDGTIVGGKISNGTITGGKIGYNTITNDNIYSISADKISGGVLRGVVINTTYLTCSGVINGFSFSANGTLGKSTYVEVPTSITVQDGRIVAQTWKRLVFKGGILTDVEDSW